MKYYQGKSPCPGCGRTGEQQPRKSKDGLCYDCEKQLGIGRALAKERALERNFYKIDELRVAHLTWYSVRTPELDRALRELLKTFSQFDTQFASVETREHGHLSTRSDAVTAFDNIVLPRVTFEAARAFVLTVMQLSADLEKEKDNYRKELQAELAQQKNDIYNEGVRRGRDLLFQLNSGEITPADFTKNIKRF